MPGSGHVKREVVLDVLRRNGVDIYVHESEPNTIVLAKGDVLEAKTFPPLIGRRLLQYLKRRFGTPIHHFYQPLEAPQLPDEDIQ